jgi:hypothetical protein
MALKEALLLFLARYASMLRWMMKSSERRTKVELKRETDLIRYAIPWTELQNPS